MQWNRYAQPMLAENIYKPVMRWTRSSIIALFATFFVSGVYLHSLPAYVGGVNVTDNICIALFFMTQALFIAIEKYFYPHKIENTFLSRTRTKLMLLSTIPLVTQPVLRLFGI
jgi:hypothetical protein